jgi:mRNA interferase MazF
VWWCSLGVNIGREQDGKTKMHERPILIIKGFNQNSCLIVPLTTSLKENKYLIDIGIIKNKKSKAIISQV